MLNKGEIPKGDPFQSLFGGVIFLNFKHIWDDESNGRALLLGHALKRPGRSGWSMGYILRNLPVTEAC